MSKEEPIKDEIHLKCWGNIKLNVRTNIYVTKDELQTERQWAKQGYVVDRPSAEHARGQQLWTNSFCRIKCLYYFKAEVRKGTEDELRKYFEPERKKRNALAKKKREQKKEEREEEKRRKQAIANAVDNLKSSDDGLIKRLKEIIGTQQTSDEIIPILCREIIKQVIPTNTKISTVIVVDTETTGLDYSTDELLQVSIISDEREILYNSYIKPMKHNQWIEAQRVNHISPDMVKDSPTILSECVEINSILKQADVIIGYNTYFDLDFLANVGCEIKDTAVIIDVMHIFAEIYGEWSDEYSEYKLKSLITCASHYGYEWQGSAHDSLADCLATLYCYEQINKNSIKENVNNG
ncbi:MAG: 3'-5' exonuclease [Acutalibacteraceae bacterium]|nr:3'-5' exonuclease [Acutalibacteraceae bacterium]